MSGIIERLKHIPIPIWIGLGLVVIFIVFLSSKKSSAAASTGAPVTDATVGTQGSQSGAGTDQQLGNLSQITQAGFADIAKHEQANSDLISQIGSNMSGVGTPLQQFGGAIQATQNGAAQQTAAAYSGGQQINTNGGGVPSSHTLVGHYKVSLPGGGDVTVNANSLQAARENAAQETGFDTSHTDVATVTPPRQDTSV